MPAEVRAGVVQQTALCLRAGDLYRYHEVRRLRLPDGQEAWQRVGLGVYRVLCVARHVHSGQDQVVYEGVGGPDGGRAYTCTLSDWAAKFEAVDPPS